MSWDPRRVLSVPAAYRFFQKALGADRARARLTDLHLQAGQGSRVLDIGCGTADILDHLPEVQYVGFDSNPAYIERNKQRFGDRGVFVTGTIQDPPHLESGTFDLVLASAVIHHVDDQTARSLFALGANALAANGKMVTIDCALYEGQSALEQFVVSKDRGEYVRSPDDYVALARTCFESVTPTVYRGMLRIPYTHVVVECNQPTR